MLLQNRKTEIDSILNEINELKPAYIYNGVKIQTGTFIESEDPVKLEKDWNELHFKLFGLNRKLQRLQTKYQVDFFDDRNIFTTTLVVLNIKVDINTFEDGWKESIYKKDINKLLIEVYEQLQRLANEPRINNIITLD